MSKKYLVTTAIQQTWQTNTSVLFLGEWCKRYSSKETWQELNYETVEYHWDNREKLYKDYCYLNELYEIALKKLTHNLNGFHKTNHNARYWRIILGPWLGQFIQILFDRWQMVDRAVSDFNIVGTTLLKMNDSIMVPHNMSDFMIKCSGDEWNHYIYAEIIKEIAPDIEIDVQNYDTSNTQSDNKKKVILSKNFILGKIKKITRSILNRFTDFFNKRANYFFTDIFLSGIQQAKLELSLMTFPSWFMTRYSLQELHSIDKRPNIGNMELSSVPFEVFLYKMIQKQIPLVYLEGYSRLENQVKNCRWPRLPEVIMTCTSHLNDDFFKVWAATKINAGTKLVIGQHASVYGSGKWFFYEDHELKICDKYFSWGWREYGTHKIVANSPARLINSKSKLKSNPKGGLLQVLTSLPRYSYHLYSSPVSSQMLSYEEEQLRFAKQLSTEIRSQLTIRPYIVDYGWDQKARWNNQYPEVRLDDNESFYTTMSKNRLLLGTANSTVFLESLSANIPIVTFWNPVHWELRESAKPFYDLLVSVSVLHDSPENAADFINETWNSIELWWNSNDVQKARTEFCKEYADSQDEWIKQWKTNLDDVAKQ